MTQHSEAPVEALETAAGQLLSASGKPLPPRKRRKGLWSSILFYVTIGFFILNILGIVGTVLIDSFGKEWFNTWLPDGLTTNWYVYLSSDHDIGSLIFNTLFIGVSTTLLALVIGFPAAYVLARKQFRFKNLLTALYLLPMLIPPLVYGIPLSYCSAPLPRRWPL